MCVHAHAYVCEYICMCEFRFQLPMVHAGRSEDNPEYQSSPSVLFETGLLVCCSAHHAWQATGNSLVSTSHLSAGALGLWIHATVSVIFEIQIHEHEDHADQHMTVTNSLFPPLYFVSLVTFASPFERSESGSVLPD